MKRKLAGLLAAALVLAQPLSGMAAGSTTTAIKSSGGGGGAPTSSRSGSYRPMSAAEKAAPTGPAADGTTVNFVDIDVVKGNFTARTVEVIKTINAGTTPLYRAIGTPEFVGWSALAPIQVTDTVTDAAISMYVPNLVMGYEIQIMYYNAADSKWVMAAPAAIDYATSTVTTNLPAGTAFTVIYK